MLEDLIITEVTATTGICVCARPARLPLANTSTLPSTPK